MRWLIWQCYRRFSSHRSCFVPSDTHFMTKPTKWHVRPAKTRISLGISPVWSVFTVHMKKAWVLSYPLSAQQRLWSDWVDAQADLSLRRAHMPFRWLGREAAHFQTNMQVPLEMLNFILALFLVVVYTGVFVINLLFQSENHSFQFCHFLARFFQFSHCSSLTNL